MNGLMRRIKFSSNSKFSYTHFANIIKPHNVEAYIYRTSGLNKIELLNKQKIENDKIIKKVEMIESNKKRPLTTFNKT